MEFVFGIHNQSPTGASSGGQAGLFRPNSHYEVACAKKKKKQKTDCNIVAGPKW